MSNNSKIIRNIIMLAILTILIIIACITNVAKAKNSTKITINELMEETHEKSWYDINHKVGESVEAHKEQTYDDKGAYCVDWAEQFSGETYKIVNIIDVNNNTETNKIKIWHEKTKKFNKAGVEEYSFSEKNVRPILMLTYLANKGKNETKITNWQTSYKCAMAAIFGDTTYVNQMKEVGLSDYIVGKEAGYNRNNTRLKESIKVAKKMAKSGNLEGSTLKVNMSESLKKKITMTTGNDGKSYIGKYKIKKENCTIDKIEVITKSGSKIEASGISTDLKKVQDVSKVQSNKSFYIVLDKEVEDIKTIKVTAKDEVTSIKARFVIVSGGANQNYFIYRADTKSEKPSIELEVPKFGKLEIKKEDQFNDTKLNLKDIGFVVWSESKKAYIKVNNGKISYVDFATAKKNEFKTDKNGVVPTINNLPLGKYKIYETTIPSQLQDYYELQEITLPDKGGKEVKAKAKLVTITNNEGKTQNYVQIKSSQTSTVRAINKRDFNSLIIKKIDKDTQLPLNGIEFKLYSLIKGKTGWVQVNSENKVTGVTDDFTKASPLVTVNNGVTPKINKLPVGKYAVYETGLGEYEDIYQELETIRINGGNTGGKGLLKGTINVEANKENEFSVTLENTQMYIGISGNVWEDVGQGKNHQTTNGLLDNNDNMINGIEVKLMDKTTKEAVQTETTANGGKYKFGKVKVEDLENYYIEFTYDGVTYQSVITPNSDSTTKITDENTSKASETTTARKDLNNTFTELTGEGQKLNYKKDITITYNKENDGDNTVVTPNNISDRNKGVNASQRIVNLSRLGDFTIESDTTSNYLSNKYKELKGNDAKNAVREIPNVNLGLYVREQPNLALEKDVSKANVSINGKTYEYGYEQKLDQEKVQTTVGVVFERKNAIADSLKYKMPVYRADAAYENEDKSKELQVSITYKLALVNNSQSLYATINSLNECYSKELEFTKMYTLEDKKEQVLSNKVSETINGDYKLAKFDNLKIKVEPLNSQYVYIQFKLPKEGYYNMANKELNTAKDFCNYAEIASYTVYSDEFDSLYAGFDTNSIPNNLNISEYEDKTKREDDSSKAPGLHVVDAGERSLTGIVFEDSDKDEKDNQRIGDGKYADGENKIANAKVRLLDSNGTEVKVYDSEKKEFVDQNSKSNENGEFTINGFIPGDYTVQYTWGEGEGTVIKNGKDTAVTVDAYKSTIWTDENKKEKESKTWYLQNDPRYSDAIDNYEMRKALDANNANLLEMLNNPVSDLNGLSNKATMKSDTKGIEVGIETKDYEEVLVNDTPVYKFNIKNIDLGLIERPRQTMEVSKSVESLRLVTDANQVILEAKVNDEGKLEVQAGSVTGGPSYGYVRAETDNDLINGSTAIVGYKITVKNTSEKDYASKDYYLYGKVDESKAIALKATAVYDYLKGLNANVEANVSWKVLENNSDEIKETTVSEKTTTMMAQSDSSSSWYSYKNSKTGETICVEEVTGEETKQILNEYAEEMKESSEKTFKNLITENRVASKFEEDGKSEIELKAGEQKEVKFSGKQVLSNTQEIRFDNDVEIANIIRTGETGRSVVLEYSNLYNRSQWVTITPPTGEDKDYTAIIVISVAAVAILGAGIVFIKKKVLK